MKNVRPIVLWACAIILGVAAGLNYVRIGAKQQEHSRIESERIGFKSPEDYTTVASLLDETDLQALTDQQLETLARTASAKGNAPDYVAGVLYNVHNESLAERLIPIAGTLKRTIPTHPLMVSMAETWKKNGCPKAAADLDQMLKQ
jgi:hypothetical protein